MTSDSSAASKRNSGAGTILSLLENASKFDGQKKLQELVRGIGELFEAETTFVAHALDSPTTEARVIAAWKDGTYKPPWDYKLEGNPCALTYDGNPTFIPCDVARQFEKKKDSGYSSYIGIPLKDIDDETIGHIAIYSSSTHEPNSYAMEVAQISGHIAQAEVQRIIAEGKLKGRIDELSSMQELSNDAIKTVAHDIRSPLGAVIGILSMAEEHDNPANVASMISNARKAVEQLVGFASEYLDLERLKTADTTEIMTSHTSVQALVDHVLLLTKQECEHRDLSINVSPFEDGLAVRGSLTELQRVLMNLTSNAIKFSEDGGHVDISATQMDDALKISVRDYGPGVSKTVQTSLFEPFSNCASSSRGIQGAGLGLSIAKKIVERHSGDINFENHDDGSTFYFTIPT